MALNAFWRKHPPLALMIQTMAGIKGEEESAPSITDGPAMNPEEMHRAFTAALERTRI
jgi:hypothetical protein